jgi:hypothetical protein
LSSKPQIYQSISNTARRVIPRVLIPFLIRITCPLNTGTVWNKAITPVNARIQRTKPYAPKSRRILMETFLIERAADDTVL